MNNDFARNIIIVDNSLSSYAHNRKINILVLGCGPTFGIIGSFGSAEKKFSINFSKANRNLCLNLHYDVDNTYLFVNGKEIFKFKSDKKIVNFPTQFYLGSISNGVSATESSEVSLNRIVYDFSVDYNTIVKYKTDCCILHTVLSVIILLLMITIICYHYAKHRSKQKVIYALKI